MDGTGARPPPASRPWPAQPLRPPVVVPDVLRQLARQVMCMFYDPVYLVLVEALVRHQCLKEDDIGDVVGLNRKLVAREMAYLATEKIVLARQMLDASLPADSPDAQRLFTYWSVDYEQVREAQKVALRWHCFRA